MTPRVAVVTGGTRGIGRGISLALAAEGTRVFALYARNRRAAEDLERLAEEKQLAITCLRGDLTRQDQLETTLKRLREATSEIHFLIHSAASGVHKPIEKIKPKHLSFTFEVNVFSFHTLLLALLDRIPSGGRIVGITSNGGRRALPAYTAVGASKGALESLFRHYACELAPKGIAANLVSPGLVLTDAVEAFPDKEERILETTSQTPTGRLTTVEDVARIVSYLCLHAPSQIVGQILTIDGGKSLRG